MLSRLVLQNIYKQCFMQTVLSAFFFSVSFNFPYTSLSTYSHLAVTDFGSWSKRKLRGRIRSILSSLFSKALETNSPLERAAALIRLLSSATLFILHYWPITGQIQRSAVPWYKALQYTVSNMSLCFRKGSDFSAHILTSIEWLKFTI